jgi:RNA polymerase sigma-70 factor (ECF subfamily)
MDDLIKLVRTYRFSAGLSERLRLAEAIFRIIEPQLRLFVHSRINNDSAQDALQEVLKAIATSLHKFQGDTEKQFWAWCYQISKNKLSDHYRQQYAELAEPVAPDELWRMMEVSAQDAPISAQTRHDLDYAIKLLSAAKPECYDLLWKHFVIGLDYAEIAAEKINLSYDAVRMQIGRCLEQAKSLIS